MSFLYESGRSNHLRIVLYEGNGSAPFPGEDRFAAMTALLERGYAVTRPGRGSVAPADRSALLVLGRFEKARPPLAEDQDGTVPIRFEDVTALNPQQIAETVETVRNQSSAVKHGDWKPWFPVIDYDRCTNCMQCLELLLVRRLWGGHRTQDPGAKQ
jgi:hypothetical protein